MQVEDDVPKLVGKTSAEESEEVEHASETILNSLLSTAKDDPGTDVFLERTYKIGAQIECYTKSCYVCSSPNHLVKECSHWESRNV